jgi:hypothetical protein
VLNQPKRCSPYVIRSAARSSAELLRCADPPSEADIRPDVPSRWPPHCPAVRKHGLDAGQLLSALVDLVINLDRLAESVSVDWPLRLHNNHKVVLWIECDYIEITNPLTVAVPHLQTFGDHCARDCAKAVGPTPGPTAKGVPKLTGAGRIRGRRPKQSAFEPYR